MINETRRQVIVFGGSAAAIESKGPRAKAITDLLFKYAPTGDDTPPQVTYRLTGEDDPELLTLHRDDFRLYRGSSDAAVAEMLLGETCHHLAAESTAGLMFHAAALSWRGQGILIPGMIGAGKTTLTAWLVAAHGLGYLTDELVFVPSGTLEMQAFTRPLNLKPPAKEILKEVIDFQALTGQILEGSQSLLLPPASLSQQEPLGTIPIGMVLFPRFATGGELILEPLSKAQAGLALMECLVNARNLAEHGFPHAVNLARGVTAFSLSYGGFDQIQDWIEELLNSL